MEGIKTKKSLEELEEEEIARKERESDFQETTSSASFNELLDILDLVNETEINETDKQITQDALNNCSSTSTDISRAINEPELEEKIKNKNIIFEGITEKFGIRNRARELINQAIADKKEELASTPAQNPESATVSGEVTLSNLPTDLEGTRAATRLAEAAKIADIELYIVILEGLSPAQEIKDAINFLENIKPRFSEFETEYKTWLISNRNSTHPLNGSLNTINSSLAMVPLTEKFGISNSVHLLCNNLIKKIRERVYDENAEVGPTSTSPAGAPTTPTGPEPAAPIPNTEKVDNARIETLEKEIASLSFPLGEEKAKLPSDNTKVKDYSPEQKKTLQKVEELQEQMRRKKIEKDREERMFLYFVTRKIKNKHNFWYNPNGKVLDLTNTTGGNFRDYDKIQYTDDKRQTGYFKLTKSGFTLEIQNANEIIRNLDAESEKAIYKIIKPDGSKTQKIVGYEKAKEEYTKLANEYDEKMKAEFNAGNIDAIRTEINADLVPPNKPVEPTAPAGAGAPVGPVVTPGAPAGPAQPFDPLGPPPFPAQKPKATQPIVLENDKKKTQEERLLLVEAIKSTTSIYNLKTIIKEGVDKKLVGNEIEKLFNACKDCLLNLGLVNSNREFDKLTNKLDLALTRLANNTIDEDVGSAIYKKTREFAILKKNNTRENMGRKQKQAKLDMTQVAEKIKAAIEEKIETQPNLSAQEKQEIALKIFGKEKEAFDKNHMKEVLEGMDLGERQMERARNILTKAGKWWDDIGKDEETGEISKWGKTSKVAISAIFMGSLTMLSAAGLSFAPPPYGIAGRLFSRAILASAFNMAASSKTGQEAMLKMLNEVKKIEGWSKGKKIALAGGGAVVGIGAAALFASLLGISMTTIATSVAISGAGMIIRHVGNKALEKKIKDKEKARSSQFVGGGLEKNEELDINKLSEHLAKIEFEYDKISRSLTNTKWGKNLANGAVTVGVGVVSMYAHQTAEASVEKGHANVKAQGAGHTVAQQPPAPTETPTPRETPPAVATENAPATPTGTPAVAEHTPTPTPETGKENGSAKVDELIKLMKANPSYAKKELGFTGNPENETELHEFASKNAQSVVFPKEAPQAPATEAPAVAENLDTAKPISTEFTVELGKAGAPKNLETVFSTISANHLTLPADGIINDEFATKSLNMGANLVKLAEGHSTAGVTTAEWIEAAKFENGKLEIVDHEKFNAILAKLETHADENWEKGILQSNGAAKDYIANISKNSWLKIVDAQELDENVQGHNVTLEKIHDFGPRKIHSIIGHAPVSQATQEVGQSHHAIDEDDEELNTKTAEQITAENAIREKIREQFHTETSRDEEEAFAMNKQSSESTYQIEAKEPIDTTTTHDTPAEHDNSVLTPEQKDFLAHHPEFAKNTYNLPVDSLREVSKVYNHSVNSFLDRQDDWKHIGKISAKEFFGKHEVDDSHPNLLMKYAHDFREVTELEPKKGGLFGIFKSESIRDYLQRGYEQEMHMHGNLDRIRGIKIERE